MVIEHLTFPEAVEKLAKRAGVTLPEKELSKAEKQALARREEAISSKISCGINPVDISNPSI
mgnify:CR=1 FL=1